MITLAIPKEAAVAMATKTPKSVYSEMIRTGRISRIDILTFGMLNTTITRKSTGRISGMVVCWDVGKGVTVAYKKSTRDYFVVVGKPADGLIYNDGDDGEKVLEFWDSAMSQSKRKK